MGEAMAGGEGGGWVGGGGWQGTESGGSGLLKLGRSVRGGLWGRGKDVTRQWKKKGV